MRPAYDNLRVNRSRLWDTLMRMAEIGATEKGGCNRQALTDEDRHGRDLFKSWCEALGCTVEVDEMGSMIARRPGRNNDLPPVVLGSHLDTQPTGGKFDGVAGVLGGLEVLRVMADAGIETERPVELVNWTNEEGSRFAPSMMASGVYGGAYPVQKMHEVTDRSGASFGEELERIGYKGPLKAEPRPMHAFLELHIEQGPILEAEGLPIGIVTNGQGMSWWNVTFVGMESHAGTTPMGRRQDALVGAAEVIAGLRDLAIAYPPGVCTTGAAHVQPASRNTIPGTVDLEIDVRHPQEYGLQALEDGLRKLAEKAALTHGLDLTLENVHRAHPVNFSPKLSDVLRGAAADLELPHRDMVSGAGHDAFFVARTAPAAMIFIPCKDGISHNEAESITQDDMAAGTDVLLHATLKLANEA